MNHRPLVLVSRPYPNDETLNGLGITSFCQRYSGAERAITSVAGTIPLGNSAKALARACSRVAWGGLTMIKLRRLASQPQGE